MQSRKEWKTPALQVEGSVEELTQLKFAGGYDGICIQLDDGTVVTGS